MKGAMVRGWDHIVSCCESLKMKVGIMHGGRRGVGVVGSPSPSHMSGGPSSRSESPAKLQMCFCSSCGRAGKWVNVVAAIPFGVVVRR